MSAMIGAMLSVMFMDKLQYFYEFSVNRLRSTVRYRTLSGMLKSAVALCSVFATAQASGAALHWPGPITVRNRAQTGISSMNP